MLRRILFALLISLQDFFPQKSVVFTFTECIYNLIFLKKKMKKHYAATANDLVRLSLLIDQIRLLVRLPQD